MLYPGGGHMGSPAVSVERLANDETEQAVVDLMEYLGHKKIDAFMDLEIGGANGLQGLALGSSKNQNCPTVDADFMGMNSLINRLSSALSTDWSKKLTSSECQAAHTQRTGKRRSAPTRLAPLCPAPSPPATAKPSS